MLAISKNGEKIEYQAKNIIIATGARAKHIPSIKMDGTRIISYKEAMIQE